MSRLHHLSERRSLLQDDIRQGRTDISGIRNHYFQSGIIEDAGGIIDILVSDIRHTDGLTMMGVDIDANLTPTQSKTSTRNMAPRLPQRYLLLNLFINSDEVIYYFLVQRYK